MLKHTRPKRRPWRLALCVVGLLASAMLLLVGSVACSLGPLGRASRDYWWPLALGTFLGLLTLVILHFTISEWRQAKK